MKHLNFNSLGSGVIIVQILLVFSFGSLDTARASAVPTHYDIEEAAHNENFARLAERVLNAVEADSQIDMGLLDDLWVVEYDRDSGYENLTNLVKALTRNNLFLERKADYDTAFLTVQEHLLSMNDVTINNNHAQFVWVFHILIEKLKQKKVEDSDLPELLELFEGVFREHLGIIIGALVMDPLEAYFEEYDQTGDKNLLKIKTINDIPNVANGLQLLAEMEKVLIGADSPVISQLLLEQLPTLQEIRDRRLSWSTNGDSFNSDGTSANQFLLSNARQYFQSLVESGVAHNGNPVVARQEILSNLPISSQLNRDEGPTYKAMRYLESPRWLDKISDGVWQVMKLAIASTAALYSVHEYTEATQTFFDYPGELKAFLTGLSVLGAHSVWNLVTLNKRVVSAQLSRFLRLAERAISEMKDRDMRTEQRNARVHPEYEIFKTFERLENSWQETIDSSLSCPKLLTSGNK